jgi:hypothetical protein
MKGVLTSARRPASHLMGGRSARVPPRFGLAAWYHTGAGVVADAAGNISQWSDLSGKGHYLQQASGAAQPLLTRVDCLGNLLLYSEQCDQSPWVLASGVTVGSASGPPAGVGAAQQVDSFNGLAGLRVSQVYQSGVPMSGRSLVGFI